MLPWFHKILQWEGHDRHHAAEWRDTVRASAPLLIEECQGIAAGLGLEFESYFSVLCRFQELPPRCTTFGVRGKDGNPLVGKTDDLYRDEVGHNVLETTIPDQGFRHIHFHFGGTAWTIAGMNDQGLAIAMTGIPGLNLTGAGIPSLWALHDILPKCATVPEAVAHIEALNVIHYGFSLQIADAQGDLVLIEKTGRRTALIPDQKGMPLVHTNHILDLELSLCNPKQNEPLQTNSLMRYDLAAALAQEMERSEDGLVSILSSRTDRGAIFQQGEGGLYTDFAVIFMPAAKQVDFWQAASDEPTRFTLNEDFFQKSS